VLHLATHGFALAAARDPASMPGRRAVGGVLQAGEATGPRSALPVLPGLALAGANRVEGRAEGDGFLTAEEVTALDLRDCEWAVLSACETGHHDASAAEAVQGLQRAFRRAGARTVVMSLWAVDDAATQEGMRALYAARFGAGLSTDVALRTACRQVLAARRARGLDTHPFHWAGFVAAGDWR
jgi:CHAT domain-containing protein